jgi:hypothetical protein
VADTTHTAMSRTYAAAMSPTATGSATTATGSATTATTATTATGSATTATTATAAATTATSEQRRGRCNQQCRYGDYCKKLGYPRHDDLLFAFNSEPNSRATRRGSAVVKVERPT